jgi:hypothetical protein
VSYGACTAAEREVVDYLMKGQHTAKHLLRDLADKLGIVMWDVKRRLAAIYVVYGIDSKKFNPHVRLVYLRAKELGLL